MRSWWLSALAAVTIAGCAPAETRLEVATRPQGNAVKVSGETSLPDGAQLNLSLHKPGAEEALAVALPVVKASRYEALLEPRTDLPAGSYQVRVEFTPRAFAWSKAVLPAVGENGEKLGGPHVKVSNEGYRYLWIEREVTLP